MSKNKTHKGAKKRVKVTATGKLVRRKPFKSHLLTKKSANKKRKLRKSTTIQSRDQSKMRDLLGG